MKNMEFRSKTSQYHLAGECCYCSMLRLLLVTCSELLSKEHRGLELMTCEGEAKLRSPHILKLLFVLVSVCVNRAPVWSESLVLIHANFKRLNGFRMGEDQKSVSMWWENEANCRVGNS